MLSGEDQRWSTELPEERAQSGFGLMQFEKSPLGPSCLQRNRSLPRKPSEPLKLAVASYLSPSHHPNSEAVGTLQDDSEESLELQYESYLVQFNKTYPELEKDVRKEFFRSSLQRVKENRGVLGLTEFSDWSPEEWASFTTSSINLLPDEFYYVAESNEGSSLDMTASPQSSSSTESSQSSSSIIDWVREGVVSPPSVTKQDGPYCWSHAAVSTIEAQIRKQSKEAGGNVDKRKLSVQQFMDCVQQGSSTACFAHAVDEGILESNAYPYVGPPPKPCYCKHVLKPRTFLAELQQPLMHVDERVIKDKLKAGPLYSVLGCDPQLRHYSGGILRDCKCDASCQNHAMTLVGAGKEHGKKYWLFKNSWGRLWGEQGFLKLARGIKSCRIGQFCHHPGKIRDTVRRTSESKWKKRGGTAKVVCAEADGQTSNSIRCCCGLFC